LTALVVRSDARTLPLSDNSVDLIVTSPPYFALRSYRDGGEHYGGQVGAEATPAEFVAALLDVTRECMRVLKPTGSLWLNLGDKYSDKTLLGLPWRYALGCIDTLGLILRAEIIWNKSNGLPESVTDRVRRSHETWFHFTLHPRYFSAVDEVRVIYEGPFNPHRTKGKAMNGGLSSGTTKDNTADALNPLGKIPGSVWTIPTQPLTVPAHLGIDHFAAFPMEWPRRIIRGWSPSGICVECGESRRPAKSELEQLISAYTCNCFYPDAPTRPAVILDPFGGTGTTALVASTLGRVGISVDLSHDYSRLAPWRTTDPKQRTKAAG